jgi:hypothetical protein
MAFDDRKTEPLIAVGCCTVVCGLAAAASWRFFGLSWGLALLAIPPVVWLVLESVWRREDRARRSQ